MQADHLPDVESFGGALRLDAIHVKNFRALRDVRIQLSSTTLLIGENNCGKTSLLEAIRLILTRGGGRKTGTFEPYDYHLANPTSEPQSADPISITLTFKTNPGEQLDDEFIQTLGDILVTDAAGQSLLVFRVTSGFDATLNDFISEWQFLDDAGNPLGPKSKRPAVLQDFQRLFPIFYLSALRDAVREFRTGSYWTPFIKNPSIPQDIKEKLQEQINELNKSVLDAHASLKTIKTQLAKIQELVPLGKANTVGIDALPGRISDLLTGTQVSMSTAGGASIPLARHGAGTQSLSVLFLFQAYLNAMLTQQYSELSSPILALEEPEAHLHPFATRSLWSTLDAVPGQKIIASHSGDLVANAPIESIRRLYVAGGDCKIGVVTDGLLSTDDKRKIQFHIQGSRGELLFARCWLLYEGETEHWMLEGLARVSGKDIDRWGVRMVAYRQSGHECLFKVANALGIPWFLVADGDNQGTATVKGGQGYLDGAKEQDRIMQLTEDTIELHLCANGLGVPFEKHLSPQKQGLVKSQKGTAQYWKEVMEAQSKGSKPAVIQEVMQLIEQGATPPPALAQVLDQALKLAGA